MSFSWSLTRAHKHTVTICTYCRKYATSTVDGAKKKQRAMVVVGVTTLCNFCTVASSRSACIHSASLLHLLSPPFFFLTSLSNAKPPCLSLSLLFYGLHVFTVSLGHCSAARLPQSIGHGWLANRSYTLKREKPSCYMGHVYRVSQCVRKCVLCCIH